MKHLISDSTGSLTYTPSGDNETEPTLALAVVDETDAAITATDAWTDATDTVPGFWTATIASSELSGIDYHRCTATWAWEISGPQVLTDVEHFEVLPYPSEALCFHKDVRTRLKLALGDDDEVVGFIIEAASKAIRDYPGMPRLTCPPATESRIFQVLSEETIFLDECISITGVTDSDGDALDYTVRSGRRSGDFVRWVELDDGPVTDEVTIAGTWGYYDIPADLQQAAIVTSVIWHKNERQAFAVSVDANTGFATFPELGLPRRVVGMLQHYIQSAAR